MTVPTLAKTASDASPGPIDAQKQLQSFVARMSIPNKMLAGYVILAALSLSVAVYVLVSLFQINRLNLGIVKIDIPLSEHADKMIAALLAQNGHEKRYIILRGNTLRNMFWERSKEFDELLLQLKRLSADAGPALADLEHIHDRYGRTFTMITTLAQRNRLAMAQRLSQETMNGLLDRMLGILRRIPEQALLSRDDRTLRIGTTSRDAFRTTFILCLVTTVVSIVAALLMTFSITSPIRRLTAATKHIGEGKFDVRLRSGEGDEVAELSGAFEQMALRLKKMEEMYLDASPLTRLSGGLPIEREIERRIKLRVPMALSVMDIDNFKAFNDRYGYAHGNEVIRETAKIIESAARTHGSPEDFVGHVGGDDFVVVTTPDHMRDICAEIISRFDSKAPEYYEPRDREQGYIFGKTRQGVDMKFPFVSISIAVITNLQRTFVSALEMSEVAAELKDYAKTFPRSLYVIDQRRT